MILDKEMKADTDNLDEDMPSGVLSLSFALLLCFHNLTQLIVLTLVENMEVDLQEVINCTQSE